MKKVIIALLVIMVIALGAGIYWKIKVAKLPIERITPEKPLVYAHLIKPAENWDRFIESKFWSQIREIDFGELMGPVYPEFEAKEAEAKSEILDFLKELGIRRFFGKELAIAVYPAESVKTISSLIPDIVLISRVEPEAKLLTLVAKLYEKLFDIKEVVPVTEEYREHEITTIRLEEFEFDLFYTYIKDLLAVSNSKERIKRSIDLSIDARDSLAQDKDFRYIRGWMPGDTAYFSYFDTKVLSVLVQELEPLILKQMAGQDPSIAEKTKEKIRRALEQLEAFKNGGVGFTLGKIPTVKGLMMLDSSKMMPHIAKLYEFEPEKNRSLNFVPQDVIFYHWINNMDLQSYWENLQHELSIAKQDYDQDLLPLESFIQDFESDTGIDIEGDIIPLADNEFVFLLSDIDVTGMFPIPKIAFFIEVKDEFAAERFLDTYMMDLLAERVDIRFSSEVYSERTINYMVLPFGAGLQPCYSLVDGFLIISISRDLLKEIIDTLDKRYASLPQSYNFKAIDIGLTGENNSVSFLNLELSLDRAGAIAEWAIAWQNMAITGMSQRLKQMEFSIDSLKLDFGTKESQIDATKLKLRPLEEEIQRKRSEAQDTSIEEESLKAVEEDLAVKEKELAQLREEIEKNQMELDEHRKAFEAQRQRFEVMETGLEQIIYPVMEALRVFKSVGSKKVADKDHIETATYLNIKDK